MGSIRVWRNSLLAAMALAMAVTGARAETREFAAWLDSLRAEAMSQGIRPSTLDAALAGVAPIPRVIELDRQQPEFTLTFDQYLSRVVNEDRVRRGRRLMREHRALLDKVARTYRVQPRFIVALWGIETDYGRLTGGFRVIDALATLAWEGRRAAFFRKELLNALAIIDQGHIRAEEMKGSWAGAMGQCQFMPSSFLAHAQDFDGDGHSDIWNTRADVFASTANYLAKSGWRDDQTWGRKVRLPAGFDRSLIGLDVTRRLSEWQRLGVRRADGRDLPSRDLAASIVLADGDKGPAFLVYDNYRAVLTWNRSTFFALAVGHLADRLWER